MRGIMRERTPQEMRFATQLSDWIRRLRVSGGLTHSRLAEVAGVIPSTLQKWERGESMPNPFQLYLLRSFARRGGMETPEL